MSLPALSFWAASRGGRGGGDGRDHMRVVYFFLVFLGLVSVVAWTFILWIWWKS